MSDPVDAYLDQVPNLPPCPKVMVELMRLLEQPDRDIDQIIAVMSHDPSLTAEILRRCNSAYFGSDGTVTDIFEAAFRLGFYEVYRVATSLFASRAILAGGSADQSVSKVWEHSALTAVAAGLLARDRQENESIAFTAGLLHDIGRVILHRAEGARYHELVKAAGSEAALPLLEIAMFQFDHAQVGARLLARWELPDEFVKSVANHHSPERAAPFERLAAVLSLADAIAQASPRQELPWDAAELKTSSGLLKMTKEDVVATMESLESNSDQVRKLFQG